MGFFMKISPLPRFLRLVCWGALALGSAVAQAEEPQLNLQRVQLTAGIHRIDAQLALSPQERQIGLQLGEVRSTDCVMTGFTRWTPGPDWQVQAIGLSNQTDIFV